MPSERQLREVFEALGDGVFIARDDGVYLDVNTTGCAMLGYSRDELLQLSFSEILDPSEWGRLYETVASFADGGVHRSEWVFRRKDGTTFTGELVGGRLPDGRFQSVVRDISDRIERERHIQLLSREAAHRTRNILSLVQAIARQTASHSPHAFLERFDDRIAALSASHSLLLKGAGDAADLQDLVTSQLGHFAELIGGRIALEGPPIQLNAQAAQAVGMALHELATNAGKYGALATATGAVHVAWDVDANASPPAFSLRWRERGGPEVRAPERTGFGTRMISQLVRGTLHAEVELDWDRSGLAWRLRCPLDAATQPGSHETEDPLQAAMGATLRVLVFDEDSPAAASLVTALTAALFSVRGPTSDVAAATVLLADNSVDAAVVSVDAIPEDAAAFLDALRLARKPMILIAGPDTQFGGETEDVFRRPVSDGRVITRLITLMHAGAAGGRIPADA